MQPRKFTIAAAATVAGLGIFGAVAAATGGHSNAGKAFASRPIIKTTVHTTHKVVHIKAKTKRIKVSAPVTAAPRSAVVYVQPPQRSAPSAQQQASAAPRAVASGEQEPTAPSGEPQDFENHDSAEQESND